MRLIDADKLMGELHESLKGDCDLRKDYEFMGIDEFIENQPTAYNVDKVLEQLEYSRVPNTGIAGYHKVVEIVKGGGIDGNTNT
ncbi:hypothetical protein [uncultured Eubacterium sp.]|jgi:hypothetical protein|uniref:hypothetical protein n=1 Tax=uncultured Eubacterium sp. TaxID=165185 RepID=UPI002594AF01|nr:hypothetical protein [uncultured Eubacterium sp.]